MKTIIKTIVTTIGRFKRTLIVLLVLVVAGTGYYYYRQQAAGASTAQSYYAVNVVGTGAVSSGIQTTGTINAEQELDLNIYKQLKRITAVNVVNGQHVDKKNILVAFDKSDANVSANQSKAALTSAQLALQNAQANAQDPNTQIISLQSQIASQRQSIVQSTQNMTDAYRTFLNADIDIVPDPSMADALQFATKPVLSGTYTHNTAGSYTIKVYPSNTQSGFSFSYNGIEVGSGAVVFNTPVALGAYGLKISFPSSAHAGDTWTVKLPNTDSASYALAKQTYDTAVTNAQNAINAASSTIASDEQQIKTLEQTNTTSYRDLTVTQAQNAVQQAQQNLTQSYTTISDRNIIAPFSGTVEGMQNVVVGATPVGGTSDTINLGTLISDNFITSFTLSAAEVGKVQVGQKVKVTVTSLTDQPTFDATITEISSLPASSGVAQYTVKALLDYNRTENPITLRDGMLANIEVVQQEKSDALRIPASAVTYKDGQPQVEVIGSLTDTQKQQATNRGIVRTDGTTLATYPVTVTLGIKGSYWYEVTSGLTAGDVVVTSQLSDTSNSSNVVSPEVHVPGSGAGRQGFRSGGGSTRTAQSASAAANHG